MIGILREKTDDCALTHRRKRPVLAESLSKVGHGEESRYLARLITCDVSITRIQFLCSSLLTKDEASDTGNCA
jgi:hypothetical protein